MINDNMGARPAADPWRRMREEMPAAAKWAYFDHAAVAPVPEAARQAMHEWLEEATSNGSASWLTWARGVEQARATAARLMGADPSEIALVPNTTSGISIVAEGWPWQAGENVVTLANEFPSNAYPWLNLAARGVETRRVAVRDGRVDYDELAAACDRQTRLMSVSWVGYASGLRLDVARLVELAHARGVLLLLDAIQAFGVFPIDVRSVPVDFLAADGHKWMLGPEGAGLLYVRSEHLERLRPTNVGWHSVAHSHDFSRIELRLRPEAARFEGGSQNMVGMLGLGASLRWLEHYGLGPQRSPLADRVLEITDAACARLQEALGAVIYSPRAGEQRSGIVSFEIPGVDPKTVRERCLEAGVVLSCRDGRVRISPHAYANKDDIERLVDALRFARQAGG